MTNPIFWPSYEVHNENHHVKKKRPIFFLPHDFRLKGEPWVIQQEKTKYCQEKVYLYSSVRPKVQSMSQKYSIRQKNINVLLFHMYSEGDC